MITLEFFFYLLYQLKFANWYEKTEHAISTNQMSLKF